VRVAFDQGTWGDNLFHTYHGSLLNAPDGRLWMYYQGYELYGDTLDTPELRAIGLAFSTDGGYTFTKHTTLPVKTYNPNGASGLEEGIPMCAVMYYNAKYRMFYSGNVDPSPPNSGNVDGHLWYSESDDGKTWPAYGSDTQITTQADEELFVQGAYHDGTNYVLFVAENQAPSNRTWPTGVNKPLDLYKGTTPAGVTWQKYLINDNPGFLSCRIIDFDDDHYVLTTFTNAATDRKVRLYYFRKDTPETLHGPLHDFELSERNDGMIAVYNKTSGFWKKYLNNWGPGPSVRTALTPIAEGYRWGLDDAGVDSNTWDTPAHETFTVGALTELSTHTSDSGDDWAHHPAIFPHDTTPPSGEASYVGAQDELSIDATNDWLYGPTGGTAGYKPVYMNEADPQSEDYYVEAVFTYQSADYNRPAIAARLESFQGWMYYVAWDGSGAQWELRKYCMDPGGALGTVEADDFDGYSNDVDLAAQTNWTQVTGAARVYVSAGDGYIVPNSSSAYVGVRYNATQPAPDQWARLRYQADGTGYIGPSVRMATGAATFYGFYADGTNIYLFKLVGGSYTQLDTAAFAVSAGDMLEIRVHGSSVVGLVNNEPKVAANDTSITSGYAGICGYDADTSCQGDEFSFGDMDAVLDTYADTFTSGTKTVRLVCEGNRISVNIDGTEQLFAVDADLYYRGKVGVFFDDDATKTAAQGVVITSLTAYGRPLPGGRNKVGL
jgi:hypothetical protein